jgi:hypothetical protein
MCPSVSSNQPSSPSHRSSWLGLQAPLDQPMALLALPALLVVAAAVQAGQVQLALLASLGRRE